MMRLPGCKYLAFTVALLGLAGCQQQYGGWQDAPAPAHEQLEQLASVIAGTKYLKDHCHRSDLPGEEAVNQVAHRLARQRGWDTLAYGGLAARSENLYQRLTEDSTPEQVKCGTFNEQLAPFIAALHGKSGT
ncbi:type II secretion system pilot lipoprotein GspS [Zobellella sp. DQSA1]|uniref:type II secretion system pilot lipoprotein GspS n=1 Tax=Zobellella sp. DQSA1 TaxID=3342386 RepID=UPI0035C01E9E